MGDSGFRQQLDVLGRMTGRRIEWPQLARRMIAQEFSHVQKTGIPYGGQRIFIDRCANAVSCADHKKQDDERVLVYRLYRECNESNCGIVSIGSERLWLITCQVPNQARQRGRRADLLGLREDGSIVVFECKVKNNRSDSPLSAMLEGLDYLSHLLIPQNFKRLSGGFSAWRKEIASSPRWARVPLGFEKVSMKRNARHAVFVAAPQEYYEAHLKDSQGVPQQWEHLSDRSWPQKRRQKQLIVELGFVVTDYHGSSCTRFKRSV